MTRIKSWQSTTALVIILNFGVVPLLANLTSPTPTVAQASRFRDVSPDYWAAPFINALVARNIISGFPDGTFKPNDPVTRAQFAAMVRKAFNQPETRTGGNFRDVSRNYWANPAIQEAYRKGFLSGYPNNLFRPTQNIPKEQVLTALANGLNYRATGSSNDLLNSYQDRGNIANFAVAPIAAATENNLVVNYPNLRQLNPKSVATRGEVAAIIYQALVNERQAERINSQYLVNQTPIAINYRIPAGVNIPIVSRQDRILVSRRGTMNVTMVIAANITTNDGTLLIPANTQVMGELRTTREGAQFVAQQLVFVNGETVPIQANSAVVRETEITNLDLTLEADLVVAAQS